MKNMFRLFFAALVLHTQSAAGDDIKCTTAYRQAMTACARSFDGLTMVVRAGAQRACVDGARLTQAYCMSGSNPCLDDTLAAYDRSLARCEADFDPAACAGELACEQIIAQQRDNCISYTVSVLDARTAACGAR
jgi:hypothetical protein